MNLRVSDQLPVCIDSIVIYGRPGRPLAGNLIKKVEADARGNEWIYTDSATMRYGSSEVRQGTDSVVAYPAFTDSRGRTWTTDADVLLWTEDRFGTLWQLTRDGRVGYYSELSHGIITCHRLPAVGKYLTDRQGNLWVTSEVGLSLINFRYNHIRLVPQESGQPTRSVLCRRNGTVWAGSQDGYISIYTADGTQQGWLKPDGSVSTTRTRFSNRVYALFEDAGGNIWIGSKGEGLYVLCGGRLSHYMPDANNAYALNSANIYDIDEDEQGHIWIATYGGGINLAAGDAHGTLRFIHKDNELKGYCKDSFYNVRRITHDGRGTMLASTTTGLLTFSNRHIATAAQRTSLRFHATTHQADDTTSLRTNDVMQTLVDGQATAYVTTQSGTVQQLTGSSWLADGLPLRSLSRSGQAGGYPCASHKRGGSGPPHRVQAGRAADSR